MREFSDRKNAITGIVILSSIIILSFSAVAYNSVLKKHGIQVMTTRGNYRNGEYDVIGEYTSPGGPEEIGVKIILRNDLIIKAEVEALTHSPSSIIYQNKFIAGFKEFVVGKDIDDVQLDVVSGSSLTPKGFNEALEEIRRSAIKT